ncbi:hypothetical protein ACFX2I_025486 [Malus domestica]
MGFSWFLQVLIHAMDQSSGSSRIELFLGFSSGSGFQDEAMNWKQYIVHSCTLYVRRKVKSDFLVSWLCLPSATILGEKKYGSLGDLLIPARSPQITTYDVELVQSVVSQYMMHEKYKWDLDVVEKNEKGTDTFILGHGDLS